MKTDNSCDLLEGLFELIKDPSPASTPRKSLSSYERRLIEKQASTLVDLCDHLETKEDRQYGQIRHYVDWLVTQFDIPCQSIFHKPQHLDDDVMGFLGFTATDAAGLLIFMESLGLRTNPALLVDALTPMVENKPLLTTAEHKILTYQLSVGKSITTLRSSLERDHSLPKEERFRCAAGYRYKMTRQNGQALSLEVRGPKHRQVQQIVKTCTYCNHTYCTNTPSETRAHREIHKRAQRLFDPSPNALLAKRFAPGFNAERVDDNSPMGIQREVFRRAISFKREFGYDFIQWPGDEHRSVGPDWHGYLIPAGPDGCIAGACAFALQPAEGGSKQWSLQWIWLAPKYRRHGLLVQRWTYYLEQYGDFYIEPPLSDAMKAFVRAHGSEIQKGWLHPAD
ncbi:hypothetical protein [Pseudomonas sp. NPDC089569]|uniref:hypothetical protein n=1 Tax=Pseudomonas sp. NPDC089569 TaxID=3390722 RepID=UPI003CFD4007